MYKYIGLSPPYRKQIPTTIPLPVLSGVRVVASAAAASTAAIVCTRPACILWPCGCVGRRSVLGIRRAAAAALAVTLVRLWLVVHALPRGCAAAALVATAPSVAAAISTASTATAAAGPLGRLLLLLELIVAFSALTTALLLLLLHHLLLHLLHLLHHLGVHVAHHVLVALATASAHHVLHLLHLHHVLPHGGVHVHAAVHSHLRLHHLEVLLHALEVLSHDLGCHATVAHLLAHALALVILLEFVTLGGFLLLAQVATRLSALDFDWLAVDLERDVYAGVDAGLVFKGDETKTSWASRVLVHHQRSIDNTTELGKEVAEFLVCRVLADSANKDFARFFLFIAWDSSLGINLCWLATCTRLR